MMTEGRRFSAGLLCIAAVFLLCAASRREPKTVITGDEMEIIRGGQTVVFSGNSKVTRGDSVLNADRLVQDKKSNRVEASGRVNFSTLTQDREPLYGTAGKAQYFPDRGTGELSEGRPRITYYVKGSTGPVELEADRIAFDQNTEEMSAAGEVRIVSSSATATSPSAVFFQKDKKVLLSGDSPQPCVLYREKDQESEYRADRITVYVDSKKVQMEGQVHGKVKTKEQGPAAPSK